MMTLNEYLREQGETQIALTALEHVGESQPVPLAAAQTGPAVVPVSRPVVTPGPVASVAAGAVPPTSPALITPTPPQLRVIAAHRRNPAASASELAAELELGRRYVQSVAKLFGLELPTATELDGTTLKDRVLALHKEHPELTKREAARYLGAPRGSVAAYSWALGLQWAPGRPGRPPRIAEPIRAAGSPVARASTAHRRVRAQPRLHNPFAPVDEDDEPLEVRRPKGELFWLKDRDGQYLDRYCTGMTRDRRAAWTGTAQQLAGCRRKFELARDLREMPVETQRGKQSAKGGNRQ